MHHRTAKFVFGSMILGAYLSLFILLGCIRTHRPTSPSPPFAAIVKSAPVSIKPTYVTLAWSNSYVPDDFIYSAWDTTAQRRIWFTNEYMTEVLGTTNYEDWYSIGIFTNSRNYSIGQWQTNKLGARPYSYEFYRTHLVLITHRSI